MLNQAVKRFIIWNSNHILAQNKLMKVLEKIESYRNTNYNNEKLYTNDDSVNLHHVILQER